MTTPYSTSTETDALATYIEKSQALAAAHLSTPETLERELLALIEEESQRNQEESAFSFLQGERAFFKGKYKAALKHYLSAQNVPNFHFFCYRASSFVSKELGRSAKALGYARKALTIYPNDPVTLELMSQLKESNVAAVEEEPELEQLRPFSIGDEEMNELSNLFVEEREEKKMTENLDESTSTLLEQPTEVSEPTLAEPASSLETLEQLAASDYRVEAESTSRFLSDSLGVDLESGHTLETRIKRYQRGQVEAMSRYVERSLRRSRNDETFLQILNGWDYSTKSEPSEELVQELLPSSYRHTTGGYYIRWNGKGIVINPGRNFLHNFHNEGHHIRDIDAVVVTRDDEESLADVRAIYDLNYGFNKMAADLHIINYYLNQQSHRTLATQLKPHFKQERNSVFCLDLYVDSPEVESIALSDTINLHYFPTNSSKGVIGVKLELRVDDLTDAPITSRTSVTVGYIGGTPYNPLLAHHISGTDLLIAAFDSTNANDYGKLKYNDDSLGYYGVSTLLEECAPTLLLLSEFSGREGDIRAEVSRKLKQEYAFNPASNTTIFPGDTGMAVNLATLNIRCGVSGQDVDPAQVRVAKSSDAFGQLQYLSPSDLV